MVDRQLIEKIDKLYSDNYEPRQRLGLSEVGHPCDRYLWYKHNGVAGIAPPGRVLRLFELGNIIEEHVKDLLRGIGLEVTDEQRELSVEDYPGVLTGHIDGVVNIDGEPCLLEVKSASAKNFKALQKAGYEAWDDKYRAQVHVYMILANLQDSLVVVYNKDNSEIYLERIKLNSGYALDVLKRAFDVISEAKPACRMCPNPEYYKIKMCEYREECWG
jgi:hypothetical protein